MKFLLYFLTIVCLAVGHSIDKAKSSMNENHSLSYLLGVKKIPPTWVSGDGTVLEEGRIVLTPKKSSKGSLWSRSVYQLKDSFTMEWTFRSVNYFGDSKGGISFWFISDSVPHADKSLYNGPQKYEGFQMLVDNKSKFKSTLHVLLNDGSETFKEDDIHLRAIGKCLLSYQDQSVPSTIRLSYSSQDNLFKVQVNNKVCLQTSKVKLPKGNYFIGVTAANYNNDESFEILQMKMHDVLTEESLIPNVNQMPQPQLLTKIVDKATGNEKLVTKAKFDSKSKQFSSNEIYKKLDKIEGKILGNDISNLEEMLTELMKTQELLASSIGKLAEQFGSHTVQKAQNPNDGSIDPEKYKDIFALNEKLEKMIADQQKLRDSASHNNNTSHLDSIVNKLTLFLIPLIIFMCVMTYYTIKIKQELLKTKLL
ncbi:hypothetical protein TPHA_0P00130 [Tetrapisispora phaffii CBS 4417]|uniref:L-type lectin-like domain-containing protein n=1 Tax=Tetrapisispora phaffii (strain ATCC 24235 / CBS 4417 / NBRC 1672 / NRRL Y-8282 / UCD 70-5) TaxID=1071381 RepID=G8C1Z3_TETPH|nr:hypothetical protein TPHA_0P00130 [Tetrapisispora phaffii CBS 4417]CCE66171.1 hypothetical protein TPHA_0P00130 [Tetrapisispora phaffii CBS 4417]